MAEYRIKAVPGYGCGYNWIAYRVQRRGWFFWRTVLSFTDEKSARAWMKELESLPEDGVIYEA